MPANRFNGFTEYGIGIGLRAPHYDHILSRKPVVDWFEIISENFMIGGGRPMHILDQILEQYKVVQHGVSMYFGSVQPLNREHLRRLKELVRRTKTPWLSDHLCWGSVDGRYTHDLLPMPYTFEAAKITSQKIREVRDFLEVPVVVENVSSYAEFHVSEMTEWEFLNEVVERADCGILLDVNNIYVSSRNHNFDPFTYVNSVPAERVAQIHIAGHSKYQKYILDTHDHPVIDTVWNLYARAIERVGHTATLLEWDDSIPPFKEVHNEAPNGRPMRAVAAQFIKPNDRLTSFERLEIYNKQYWFRVLSNLMEDFPGLRAVLGDRRFEAMAKAYLTDCPSQSFSQRDLGSRLEGWLRRHPSWGGSRQALAVDMARLEWADIEAFDGKAEPSLLPEDIPQTPGRRLRLRLQPYVQLLDLRYPVDDLLLEVKDDEDSDFASNAFNERRKRKRVLAVARLKPSPVHLAVHRVDYSVYFRRLDREAFGMLSAIHQGKSLSQAIEFGFRRSAMPPAERPSSVEQWFRIFATLGWFCRPESDSPKS